MIYIKNGYIKTMAGQDIENGHILIEEGIIKAIGKKIEVPDDAQIIDAQGLIVTPGLVDAHCHLGMWEEGIGFEGADGNEAVEPVTPQLRAIDSINPMDISIQEAREGGVTTAVTGPGSANVIGGTFLAMKTWGKRIDKMVIKDPVAMKIAFGENPKRVYDDQHKSPTTRMATAAILREVLFEAQKYAEDKERSITEPDEKPEFDLKLEAMLPVIKKEIPLKAHAHRADDIFTALRIAKEFDLDITLDHCTEGHLIADELFIDGKDAIVGPSFGSRTKFELKNMTFDTPRVLNEAGIKIAIMTDSPVVPLQFLSMCAGLAVKSGLPENEGWKAITINAAEIAGIADKVGSIEKDHEVKATIIDGKLVYNNLD